MEAGAAPRMSQAEMKLVGLTAMIMTITVCSENNTGPDVGPPDRLQIVSSNGQEEVVGSDLGEPLMVRTFDADDNPVPDVEVSWSVTGGGGSLSHDRSVTDESGEATTEWTLGTEPGENEVRAEIEGLDAVTFTAMALVGPPGELEIVGGDGQEAMAESVLPDSLVVRVQDGFGNPVPDVEVAWQVTEGSVSPETSTTNESGEASTEWTTGSAGPQEATAQVEGLAEVTFTAMAEEEPEPEPAEIRIVSGDGQKAEVGAMLPDPLVVDVLDEDGNPLPDVEVSWAVESGAVDPETSATNDSGRARTEWTLGDEPGEFEATATVEGLEPVTFTATPQPEPEPEPEPAEIRIVSGDAQEAEVGTTVPDPLVVEVLDQDRNSLPDIEVTWTVESGSVDPETSVTNDAGRTRSEWTLGEEPGEFEATATVEGLDPVTFTATAEPEPEPEPEPAEIRIVSGDGQEAEVGTALSDPLVVEVLGGDGAPLPDIEVTWAVWSGAGSVDPETSVTDDAGRARSEWTLGEEPGKLEATATVEGLDQVTFTAVAEPEPEPEPAEIRIVSGDGQEAEVGTTLPDPLVVEVLDGDGNSLPDIDLIWAATSGSVDPETSITNDSGRASTEWTLGDEPGEFEATATVEGLEPLTFTATAEREEPGPPANIEIVTGAPDSTVIDQALADSLAVRITDADGLPMPDVEVSWEVDSWSELVPAGLSSISPAAAFTDSDGIALAEWTIGTDPHVYFAEASAEAGLIETFETLSFLPPDSKLEAASPTDQTISVDESGDSIVIRLTDGQDTPLSDVVINWDYNRAPSLEHIAGHRTASLSPIRRRLTMQSPAAQRIVERRAVRAMSLALVPTDANGEAALVPGPFTEAGEYVIGARLEGNDVGLVAREIEFTVTVEP